MPFCEVSTAVGTWKHPGLFYHQLLESFTTLIDFSELMEFSDLVNLLDILDLLDLFDLLYLIGHFKSPGPFRFHECFRLCGPTLQMFPP